MSDKPVNLAKFRKAKTREQAKRQADANAVKFGRPKALRDQQRRDTDKASRTLDGHRRDRGDTPDKT